jgi:hypothetical protein
MDHAHGILSFLLRDRLRHVGVVAAEEIALLVVVVVVAAVVIGGEIEVEVMVLKAAGSGGVL